MCHAGCEGHSGPATGQRLKEDKDRPKYNSKSAEYGTDSVRRRFGVGNQIVERKAHDQENDEPLDPRHVGLRIVAVTPGYSNTLPHVQVVASNRARRCREFSDLVSNADTPRTSAS